ncbi:MAG: hypothetical protein U9R31_00550 [Candidatus Omnitrophota bacterium]|nr:hypothetical protein [Candidatus Omnitrophota bacterium]
MLRSLFTLILIGLVVMIICKDGFAEDVTITTYYPAPFGVYEELRARKIGIGTTYMDTTTVNVADDDLIVEGNIGIGMVTPDGKLGVDGEINFVPQAGAPAGDRGDLYYDNTNEFKYYDGTGWQTLGGGGGCVTYYCNINAPNQCFDSGDPQQGYCPAGFKQIYYCGSWGYCTAMGSYWYTPPGGGCFGFGVSCPVGHGFVCCR